MSKHEPSYALYFSVSIIISLLIDYFLISKLNLNSTINLAIGFLIFTIIIGILTGMSKKAH
jgi:hypothetical protein